MQRLQQSTIAYPANLKTLAWPASAKVLIIAPHPDDFDAIAVTLDFFRSQHFTLHLLVMSGGSKGVEDRFLDSADWLLKAATREQEQLASIRLFGLEDNQVEFLRLAEAEDGELSDSSENQQQLNEAILSQDADIWCLPYGKDTNSGHQRTYSMVQSLKALVSKTTLILYNRDAKTTEFNTHLYCSFPLAQAEWKSTLLRCHQSQQSRNLNLRGYGFDQRVLGFNQQQAQDLPSQEAFVETFQWEWITRPQS